MIINEGRLEKVTNLDIRLGIFIMPQEITVLGSHAFAEASQLRKIVWNKQLRKIERYAFSNTFLKEIELPISIIEVQNNAFSEALFLEKIVFTQEYSHLSAQAFAFCPALKLVKNGDKHYIVRSFSDGEVWEIYSNHGYRTVRIYSGRPLFSQESLRYVGRKKNVIVYGDSPKEVCNKAESAYVTPELQEKYKDITLDTEITLEQFKEITGACDKGTENWLKNHFPECNLTTLRTVRDIAKMLANTTKIGDLFTQFVADAYARRTKNK